MLTMPIKPTTNNKARYIMVGGFLGAGKTTSIGRFAEHLDSQGLKVGLITNDQGAGLVDSALGRAKDFPVEEIAGGCFCCRFSSLLDAARELTTDTRPDVLLAEPVGSCTDLVATVSLPLQKIYGDDFIVTPLSVVVDPIRALRILELEEGKNFSRNVRYIYRKQLEEAEVIVINKTDLISPERLDTLRTGLAAEFSEAKIFEIAAREGENMKAWFDHLITNELNVPRFLEIDYERYGEGESLLGWLNATVHFEAKDATDFDGNAALKTLANSLKTNLESGGVELAHLKMTLTPIGDFFEIGAINLVRDGAEPELSHHLSEPLDDGELLLNIRAEAAPDLLETAAHQAITNLATNLDLTYKIPHLEHFRPEKPKPEHRLTSL